MLIVIWYWLSTQSDCEWDLSTTNFTRHLMRAKKQNWFFVADLMTWDPTIMGKAKRCVYGLGFGRKRPNPRPSPNNWIDREKYLQIKSNVEKFTIFMCKLVNITVKFEISPNFMLKQKIKYLTWYKMVSGKLKGPFGLHLDVISKPEHQHLRKPRRLWPHCDFWSFLGDFSLNTLV